MTQSTQSNTLFFNLMTGVTFVILLFIIKFQTHGNDQLPYDSRPLRTHLGLLAQTADAVGVGKIVDSETTFIFPEDYSYPFGIYHVRIENAFVGCTNGQIIRIYQRYGKYTEMPLINTNFFFIGVTNEVYSLAKDNWSFTYESMPRVPLLNELVVSNEYKPIYMLIGADRSWWYEDDPAGQLPLQYFTNALQHLRFNRNWTNYYELCRNGVSSPSPRVKKDAHYDLGGLIQRGSTLEQLQMMDQDPLFPVSLRNVLDETIQKLTP